MSQRTGIPLNMVAKAKKMIRDGVSIEHVAQHYRCPVSTIQSLADKQDPPEPRVDDVEEEPTEENTAPDPAPKKAAKKAATATA